MNRKHANQVAILAIFIAIMIIINVISTFIFNIIPLPIKPTIVHIPVIIASVLYGPKIGAYLGGVMGIISVITNTIVILPTSYLFTPFVPHGNVFSLIIAIVPRILIGVVPYFVYKISHKPFNLFITGAVGSLTNTIFVLGGIYLLFANVYKGDIQLLLATVLSSNSLIELIIAGFITMTILPRLTKITK